MEIDSGGSEKVSVQNHRGPSSLRLRYQAETSVIQKQLGSLETLRMDLGLSRRKMAQLLMVDPSAWTRWTKNEAQTPPHIWRSLQWYLALIEKQPSWHPQNTQLGVFRTPPFKERYLDMEEKLKGRMQELEGQKGALEQELTTLSQKIEESTKELAQRVTIQEHAQAGWKLLLFFNTLFLLIFLIHRWISG